MEYSLLHLQKINSAGGLSNSVFMKKTNDFYFLNSMFPLKEIELIKFQVYSLLKKDSKNCKWSPDEDNLLRTIVEYCYFDLVNSKAPISNGVIFQRCSFPSVPKSISETQNNADKDGSTIWIPQKARPDGNPNRIEFYSSRS